MSNRQPIGIDFGTTKTLASRWDDRSQRPVAIRLGRGTDEIPTTVHVDRKGNYTFGEDAEDQRISESGGYFARIKRELERPTTHTLPTGQFVTSTELISRFLGDVRTRIENEALHGPVGHTVITVPALYGPAARANLKEAAQNAGFEDFVLLEEPVAGGSHFLYEHSTSFIGSNFAVFDWGGGTLDLAIIERIGGALKANPDLIGGDPELGGEDIDDHIEYAISEELSFLGKPSLESQPDDIRFTAIWALKVGKRLLSHKPSHTFHLNLHDGPVELPWTRKQFEEFIATVVGSAITQLTRLLAKCEAAGVKLDGVLLIGGSSEIPLVAQRIEQSTKLKSHRYDYGQSAVSLGAMLHAQKRASLPLLPINGENIEQAIKLKLSERGQKVQFTIEVAGQTKKVRVEIPQNVTEGQRLRSNGLGEPGLNGGLNGDLILVIAKLEQPVEPAPLRESEVRRFLLTVLKHAPTPIPVRPTASPLRNIGEYEHPKTCPPVFVPPPAPVRQPQSTSGEKAAIKAVVTIIILITAMWIILSFPGHFVRVFCACGGGALIKELWKNK